MCFSQATPSKTLDAWGVKVERDPELLGITSQFSTVMARDSNSTLPSALLCSVIGASTLHAVGEP